MDTPDIHYESFELVLLRAWKLSDSSRSLPYGGGEEARGSVLIETKANASRLDNVKRMLDFDGCFVVEIVGRKGGLALLWKEEK